MKPGVKKILTKVLVDAVLCIVIYLATGMAIEAGLVFIYVLTLSIVPQLIKEDDV